jgi:hypothetical protein
VEDDERKSPCTCGSVMPPRSGIYMPSKLPSDASIGAYRGGGHALARRGIGDTLGTTMVEPHGRIVPPSLLAIAEEVIVSMANS